jgi:hypothetical protein
MKRIYLLVIIFLMITIPLFPFQHDHGQMPTSDGQFNPTVIADHRGGFYLAFIERKDGKSDVFLRHSSDGKDFSPSVRVNNIPGDAVVRNENPPKLAVGSNGDLFVCWANERERWKGNIRFARSSDGGKTFSAATTLNSDFDIAPAGHAFQSIAIDKKGTILIAWIDERNKTTEDRGAEIWMATSENSGRSFSHDRKILSDVCECCRTNLQIDDAGRIFLSYRTVPAKGPMFRDIILARSSDGGQHFDQTVVSHDGWELNACPVVGATLSVDRHGHIAVIWFTSGKETGLYYAASTDHGLSFSPRKQLDQTHPLAKHAQAIANQDGTILVAFDCTGEKPEGVWAVLDPQSGKLVSSGQKTGLSYPGIAVSGNNAIVTGIISGSSALFLQSINMATISVSP